MTRPNTCATRQNAASMCHEAASHTAYMNGTSARRDVAGRTSGGAGAGGGIGAQRAMASATVASAAAASSAVSGVRNGLRMPPTGSGRFSRQSAAARLPGAAAHTSALAARNDMPAPNPSAPSRKCGPAGATIPAARHHSATPSTADPQTSAARRRARSMRTPAISDPAISPATAATAGASSAEGPRRSHGAAAMPHASTPKVAHQKRAANSFWPKTARLAAVLTMPRPAPPDPSRPGPRVRPVAGP